MPPRARNQRKPNPRVETGPGAAAAAADENLAYKTLVVVESDLKCRTVQESLADQPFFVISTGGLQLRQWEEDKRVWVEAPRAESILAVLKDCAARSRRVRIATNSDDDGELLAWHLCQVLHIDPTIDAVRCHLPDLSHATIRAAITTNSPASLQHNRVHALIAKQQLDQSLGFTATTLLRECVCPNAQPPLTAGRCQTFGLAFLYHAQCAQYAAEMQTLTVSTANKVLVSGYFGSLSVPFHAIDAVEQTLAESWLRAYETDTVVFHRDATRTFEAVVEPPPRYFTGIELLITLTQKWNTTSSEIAHCLDQLFYKSLITYPWTNLPEVQTTSALYEQHNNDKKHESTLASCTKREQHIWGVIYQRALQTQLPACKTQRSEFDILATASTISSAPIRLTTAITRTLILGWREVGATPHENKRNKEDRETQNNVWHFLTNWYQSCAATAACHCRQLFLSDTAPLPSRDDSRPFASTCTESEFLATMHRHCAFASPKTYVAIVAKLQEREYAVLVSHGDQSRSCVQITPMGFMVAAFLLSSPQLNRLCDPAFCRYVEEKKKEEEKGEEDEEENDEGEDKEAGGGEDVPRFQFGIDGTHSLRVAKYGVAVYTADTDSCTNTLAKDACAFLNLAHVRDGCGDLTTIRESGDARGRKFCADSLVPAGAREMGFFRKYPLFLVKGHYGLYCMWGENRVTLREFGSRDVRNISTEELADLLVAKTST